MIHDGYTTVYAGDRYPFHGAFVPGDANAIGYEDLKVVEDLNYLEAVASGVQHQARLHRGAGLRQHPGRPDPVLGVRRVGEGPPRWGLGDGNLSGRHRPWINSSHGKVAVITGGSQGLGEATGPADGRARGAAGHGLLVGRNAERAEAVAAIDQRDTTDCDAAFVVADLGSMPAAPAVVMAGGR